MPGWSRDGVGKMRVSARRGQASHAIVRAHSAATRGCGHVSSRGRRSRRMRYRSCWGRREKTGDWRRQRQHQQDQEMCPLHLGLRWPGTGLASPRL